MRLTRRGWEVIALIAVTTGIAVLIAAPLLLVVSAVLGGWLLASQLSFLLALNGLADTLTVEHVISRTAVAPDDEVTYTIHAQLAAATPVALTVRADLPRTVTIVDGDDSALDPAATRSATLSLRLPVAGAIAIEPPILEAVASTGLFRTTVSRGEPLELVVEPRQPRRIHVGQGGEAIPAAFGEHEGGDVGEGGTIPAGLRRYVPGDPADRIDWKATARLTEPYVRTFEPQTDLETAIVIDHRRAMATGPPGETKLDFAREVALSHLAEARSIGDPVALYAIGDEGMTYRLRPGASDRHYDRIRRRLLDLDPTTGTSPRTGRRELTTADARELLERLPDDEFGSAIRPFLADRPRYVRRLRDRPIYEALRVVATDLRTARRVVVLTDDTERTPLYEGAKLARGGDGHVVVFILPTVLFEPGGLGDLEAAYRQYQTFDEYRRDLGRIAGVDAFEVAPGDRLEAVLADVRDRRVAI